jgi:hypothetical protein
MTLPKVSTPIYEIELPSTGRKLRYRPFLVKEEKIMIIANESNDPNQIVMAVRQVLTNCILSKDVDVEDLSTFDLEYLFLNMYRRSVDEEFEMNLICPDDNETEVKVKLNVNDIKIQHDEKHTDTFEIDDNIIVKMKYPKFKQFVENNFDYSALVDEDGEINPNTKSARLEQVDQSFKLLASCIETIATKDGECYAAEDCTEQELLDFVESLNQTTFQKMSEFFETMPKLSHTIKFKNPNTKKECKITLEGLTDFFD